MFAENSFAAIVRPRYDRLRVKSDTIAMNDLCEFEANRNTISAWMSAGTQNQPGMGG